MCESSCFKSSNTYCYEEYLANFSSTHLNLLHRQVPLHPSRTPRVYALFVVAEQHCFTGFFCLWQSLGLTQSFPTPVLRVGPSHAESTIWIALCANSAEHGLSQSFQTPVLRVRPSDAASTVVIAVCVNAVLSNACPPRLFAEHALDRALRYLCTQMSSHSFHKSGMLEPSNRACSNVELGHARTFKSSMLEFSNRACSNFQIGHKPGILELSNRTCSEFNWGMLELSNRAWSTFHVGCARIFKSGMLELPNRACSSFHIGLARTFKIQNGHAQIFKSGMLEFLNRVCSNFQFGHA